MMRKTAYTFALAILLGMLSNALIAQSFVQRKNAQFILDGKPYYYIGANYWHGLFTILQNKKGAKERIRHELDFLQKKGITNLRMLASAEGSGLESGINRVGPPLQSQRGIFDANFLKALDFVLVEMRKRQMKAVLYLSNNWEWSGGFLQYLNWNGNITDAALQKKMDWDTQLDYTKLFYSCAPCMEDYCTQVKYYILSHVNSINGISYKKDPTIMAWEIANEPRPMRPSENAAYYAFIAKAARYIKSLDSNHLVTTGHEGAIAIADSIGFYQSIHELPEIDYLTIHVWPKNWSWLQDTAFADFSTAVDKTEKYIKAHLTVAENISKPLVVEEFGLPRDGFRFGVSSKTSFRDKYYQFILQKWAKSKNAKSALAGVNFWAFGGTARPVETQPFWAIGNDYSGDPPMEQQGLYSVFDCDSTTWNIIRKYALPE